MAEKYGRVWLIARHHFLSEVRKRSFILVLFSLPALMALSVGLGILAGNLTAETAVLGYVDPDGFLVDITLDEEDVEVVRLETAQAAQSALDAGDINAYYLLSPGFAASQSAELVFYQPPRAGAQTAFTEMVRRNHLSGLPPDIKQRLLAGSEVVVHPLDSDRTFGGSPSVADFLPLVTALIFSFMVVTTSSFMMVALVTEKENRTMEIVITSLSAGKLMTGKIIGGLGIALVQFLIYALCLLAGLLIGRATGVSWLQELAPRWGDIFQVVIVAIPVYLFLTAAFTTIGATLVESTEAQQIGPFAFLVLLLPIYVMPTIIENPNGPVALFFSFFPPTAIMSFALRLLLSAISWWQVLLSAAISLASAAVMTWLAAKAFRMGMLRYGQRLKLSELFRRDTTGKGRVAVE